MKAAMVYRSDKQLYKWDITLLLHFTNIESQQSRNWVKVSFPVNVQILFFSCFVKSEQKPVKYWSNQLCNLKHFINDPTDVFILTLLKGCNISFSFKSTWEHKSKERQIGNVSCQFYCLCIISEFLLNDGRKTKISLN